MEANHETVEDEVDFCVQKRENNSLIKGRALDDRILHLHYMR